MSNLKIVHQFVNVMPDRQTSSNTLSSTFNQETLQGEVSM